MMWTKMFRLSERLAIIVSGESGDTNKFAEFIEQNVQLYKIRHGYELSPYAAANFTRRNQAQSLRSRSPYFVNMLLAGFDANKGQPELYYLDYLGSLMKLPFSVIGYGGYMSLSVLDRHYRPDMAEADGIRLLRTVISEIQKRLVISLSKFRVHRVDCKGVTQLDDIESKLVTP
ncbi:hypothetical protein BOX15_Mlig005004g1 [Macrostomum lignano]|uniref:Proteasome subunit beta n=1 Tax=Macrostomum lignano TaxID=282301 RepID=A0A267FJW0_9PLAT|nr:hypothetical protein BOX15_Mlig005004g1 [Macrostomum lignano]